MNPWTKMSALKKLWGENLNIKCCQRISTKICSFFQGDEVYILTDWSTYHTWEDGRSDYGWDLSALNSNMMTYSYYGTRLTDFAVYGLDCYLPLGGKVVSVARSNPDNTPDIITAVDFGILTTGSEANLEELPNNGVEITPGGPFLLRVIHQQRVSNINSAWLSSAKLNPAWLSY